MQILSMTKQCSKCALVKSMVEVNELMIQEQIKFIKTLQANHEQLQAAYLSLQVRFQQAQHKLQYHTHKQNMLSQEQQTEQFTLEQSNTNRPESLSLSPTKIQLQKNFSQGESLKKRKANTVVNKENIEQFIPIVMIRKDEQYFSRKRKNSYQEQSLTKQWLKTMELMGSVTSNKFKQKTQHLIKKNIPHELRHIVWPIAIENQLALTDQLYFELLQRKSSWVPQEVRSQINKDLCRSFSGRTKYQSKVGLKQEVTDVLQLFHLYRPDVSYIQGMTYPVIVLTIVTGKVKAFSIFSNIVLANPFFKRLFTFEPNFILIISKAFDQLLMEFNEEVALNLKAKQIDSQTFLVEWFFTIFSRSLSFEATLRFWDFLIYFGEIALFRLALAIMDLVGPRIMTTNYQETIGLIQGFGGFGKQKKLIESVSQNKLTVQKLHKTIERFQRHFQKGQILN